MWEYIQSTRDSVCDLEKRVRQAKANVDHIVTIMKGWSQSPLYKRKDNKNDPLLNAEVSMPKLGFEPRILGLLAQYVLTTGMALSSPIQ